MPFYDIDYDPDSETDKLYQNIWYSHKNDVFLNIKNNPEEVISQISEKYKINFEYLKGDFVLSIENQAL